MSDLSCENGLNVTGLGMVSSLGHDAATSCAAARAGITRLSEAKDYELLDPDSGEVVPITAHPVFGVTEGYSGLGRLARLGAAALEDLAAHTGIQDWSRTGLLLSLPNGFHRLEADTVSRSRLQETNGDDDGENDNENIRLDLQHEENILRQQTIPTITRFSGVPIEPKFQEVFFGNGVIIIKVLREAYRRLYQDQLERVIVGAVSSGLDRQSLVDFDTLALLKTPTRPAGFIPGEMGVFVMLERNDGDREAKGGGRVTINCVEFSAEADNRSSDNPPLGRALSTTIDRTLSARPNKGEQCGLIVGNLNGDPYRAQDWGHALVRLRERYPWMDLPEWHPALSYGETGVAAGYAAICLATKALEREYAGTADILVWLCDDDRSRGSFCISKRRFS